MKYTAYYKGSLDFVIFYFRLTTLKNDKKHYVSSIFHMGMLIAVCSYMYNLSLFIFMTFDFTKGVSPSLKKERLYSYIPNSVWYVFTYNVYHQL